MINRGILAAILVGIAAVGGTGFLVAVRQKSQPTTSAPSASANCPSPLTLTTPVDASLVTAMLWPGQVRGDGFRAHGGFRFDASRPEDVSVRAPLDARLTDASRYLEQGEEQYLLFFSSPCGLSFRFDHLRTLSPKLAEALKNLPPAKPNDSRTTNITDVVEVKAGEEISHSVGISASNVFVDFGLYSADPDSKSGLCFFDYLPGSDATYLRSLPAGKEGTQSQYCNS
ncbi:MAG: hypothetical protein AAB538_02505 [Patescibacteria group bacterium]